MALVLHLSDLHLTDSDPADVLSDDKAHTLSFEELQRRLTVIKDSLLALSTTLIDEQRTLDAVVITGDVTVQGTAEGFGLVDSVLASLGAVAPVSERVLIVPGNHDVRWATKPSSPERYENFLTLRPRFSTALIEGIDIDVEGNMLTASDPVIVGGDETYLLVGINSSNHSGTVGQVNADLEPRLATLEDLARTDEGVALLLADWRRRGLYDMARVDRAQMIAAAQSLKVARESLAGRSEPLRIAALHHPIEPVTITEEIKTFDEMVNAGEFRNWLASNDIDVVLHGHKHDGRIAPTVVIGVPNPEDGGVRDILVLSSPTIQSGQSHRAPIGYLLDIEQPPSRWRGIRIATVEPAAPAGRTALDWHSHPIVRRTQGMAIVGQSVTEVHDRLVATQSTFESLRAPLVCTVQDGASAKAYPAGYEFPSDVENKQGWFDDIVSWWQLRRQLRSQPFTHGQRLFDFGSQGIDQIELVGKALASQPETSRAIAILVDPARDLSIERPEFPSFTVVHFYIRSDRLEVVAYFRKQEMPHWWPINLAELARLQEQLVQRVKPNRQHLEAGSITTVTALPIPGSGIPRVAVALIERMAETTGDLLSLVMPLFGDPSPEALKLWRRVFEDWRPGATEPADGDRVPTLGIQELADAVSKAQLSIGSARQEVDGLIEKLENLVEANRAFDGQRDAERSAARPRWQAKTSERIDAVLELVRGILGP